MAVGHFPHLYRDVLCMWRVSCDPSPVFLPNFIVVSEEYCSLRTQHELYMLVKMLILYHMLSPDLPEQSPNLSLCLACCSSCWGRTSWSFGPGLGRL